MINMALHMRNRIPAFFRRKKVKKEKPSASSAPAKIVTQKRDPKRRRIFHLSLHDQILFVRRLAILLKAGVPIFESLRMMKKHMSSRSATILVDELTVGVERGQFLHVSLEKHRRHLGDFALNIIRIGEISGMLPENLSYLADELEKKRRLRNKVRSALIYPAIIVVATIGIVIMLTVYVFPKILPILRGFKGELPITTRTLIFVSDLLVNHGFLIGGIIIGVAVALALLSRIRKVRFFLDWGILQIPILGKLFQYYHIVNFCRTLGLLLKSDVRIMEASLITAETSTSFVYKKSLVELAETVKKGGKMSLYLEGRENLYPPMVSQMLTVGEVSGKLSDSLLYLADIYEEEIDELTKNLSSTIEPLLMIVMGLIVGFVAISIITPIYQLTQNLRP